MMFRRKPNDSDLFLPYVLTLIDELYDDSMQRKSCGMLMDDLLATNRGDAQAFILLELRKKLLSIKDTK